MSDPAHTRISESEENLVALLATLKVEAVEEADFEGRFLCDFHDRVAREMVCCPARRRLLAHLLQMVDNFGRGRIAFGASALGLGVLAICFASYPAEQSAVGTTANVSSGVERQAAPLHFPAMSSDLAECTTVRVHPSASVLEVGGVTIMRGQHSTIIEVPNVQVVPQPARQGNYISLPATTERYAF
jgi:hypothetical protein